MDSKTLDTKEKMASVLRQSDGRDWSKVGIVINTHARLYSRRIPQAVKELAPGAKLYVTRTLEEAQQAVKDMVDNGVETVFSGGGDGTHLGILSQWMEQAKQKLSDAEVPSMPQLPEFGILRLGTGNAWAFSSGIRQKLQLLRDVAAHRKLEIQSQQLIESNDQLFPFAGLGWDGAIINDYNDFKNSVRDTWVGRHIEGVWMYLAAIATRTVPREMRNEHKPLMKVYATGKAQALVQHGKEIELTDIPTGDGPSLIYEGYNGLCGVSTIPYYGYKFKAFPHLQNVHTSDQFELRVVGYKPLEAFLKTPFIWRDGGAKSPKIKNFLVSDITMEFSEPAPLQLAGEPGGYCSKVHFSVSPTRVPMLTSSAA